MICGKQDLRGVGISKGLCYRKPSRSVAVVMSFIETALHALNGRSVLHCTIAQGTAQFFLSNEKSRRKRTQSRISNDGS